MLNRGLAIFSFILILLGAVSYYPITILGLILLIASIASPSRKPTPGPSPPKPSTPATQPRRQTPVSYSAMRVPATAQIEQQTQGVVQAPQSMQAPQPMQLP